MKVIIECPNKKSEEYKRIQEYKGVTRQCYVDTMGEYIFRVNEEVFYINSNLWDNLDVCKAEVRKLNKGEKVTITFEGE